MLNGSRGRAVGLALGYGLDRALADPARWHPVAGFGTLAARLEQTTYADRRSAGVVHVALLVGAGVAVGAAAEHGARHRPVAQALLTAAATWTVLGGTTLDREAAAVGRLLEEGRLPEARTQVARLVGRDTRTLEVAEVARAALESVAENTSDAVVAPLVLGALVGVPGLLGYRAANTLDAMVGHRSARYARFGWAAARLDDLLNLPGARLTAALATVLGADPAASVRAWRRDAGAHPSPNAGPVEAAFAGALGVRLGGRTVYGTGPEARVELRPPLGEGPAPAPHDVARGRRLAARVGLGSLIVLAPIAARPVRPRRR
ncbi:cobalamin biosynthesis protein [Nocardioides dokdonensis FR1436]|uniref:Cobalamin biosynthesis protein CobD n=1 Tax=Nocardioides dokdonensis FR1436 TaxID=1300347 RepID=A0A1A9GRJ3_9ACTN|nr:cobalamin biosynthesis protein [Nocardioides dokdonensis]ANH40250.1 cobalamin biosynthesis protein [Nocardioides dokdonensis FR1436]